MIGRVFQCIHRTSPVDIAPLEQRLSVQVTVCVCVGVCVRCVGCRTGITSYAILVTVAMVAS